MYYYVSGEVAHVEPYLAVIDCGGVGYACRTTTFTLSQIKKGDKAKLFTYLSVREDAMDLYGFASAEELKLFQQLISVSGVGPKAALSILSAGTPANLALAIITGDETSSPRPAPPWRFLATPRRRSTWPLRASTSTIRAWSRSYAWP